MWRYWLLFLLLTGHSVLGQWSGIINNDSSVTLYGGSAGGPYNGDTSQPRHYWKRIGSGASYAGIQTAAGTWSTNGISAGQNSTFQLMVTQELSPDVWTYVECGDSFVATYQYKAIRAVSGCMGGPELLYKEACVKNPLNQWVVGQWYVNGGSVHSAFIGPYESACYTFEYYDGDALLWGYGVNESGLLVSYTNGSPDITVTNSTKFVDYSGENPTNPASLYPVQTNQTPWTQFVTNSSIDWDSSASTNLTDVTKGGFGALLQAQQDQSQQFNLMIAKLNELNGGGGTEIDLSGVEARLDAISGNMTNQNGSTNGIWQGYTNLQGSILGATNSWESSVASLRSGLGSISNLGVGISDSSPVSLGSALTVEMVGYEWDFNPLNQPSVAGLWGIARKLFAYILYAMYAVGVLKRIMTVIKAIGTAQQGTVPNVEASALGFGGNIGVALAAVIIPLFLIIFAAISAWAGVGISGMISGEVGTALATNPFTGAVGAVATGIELARHFFPFSVAFGLFGAYLIWYGSTMAIVMFINFTMRLIFGS